MSSGKRNALIFVALCVAAAVGFYRTDAFWGLIGALAVGLFVGLASLPLVDIGWRLRMATMSVVVFLTAVVLLPSIEGVTGGRVRCPQYIKDRVTFAMAPGLDLRGGLRLVYSVEVEDAIRDKRDNFADDMRLELAKAFQLHSGDGRMKRDELEKLEGKVHVATPDSAVLKLQFKDAADAAKLMDERFAKRFGAELAMSKSVNEGEVVWKIKPEVETQIRERAVAQAKETVNRRVDELGLREASVTTRDEDIIVEVPGENEKAFDEIKDIIRRTARLEFKMVDDAADFFGRVGPEQIPGDQGISVFPENAPDGPGKSVTSRYARMVKRPGETMNECRDRMKAWVKTLGVPDDHQVAFQAVTEYDETTQTVTEIGWRTYYLFGRAEVTGDLVTDAQVARDQNDFGSFYVSLTFSPAGADRFEEVTGANVQRRFAIMLDEVIDSAPVIKTKIGGGRASITLGAGDPETQLKNARKLELVLRSGALPAPIVPANESRIGPSLGKDAIALAMKGMVIGSSMVLAFMILYYRKAGVVADLAVLLNLAMQLAILSTFNATMTLPGLAGLALTIGVAVDANVLINERIREELRAGKTMRAAVDAGYDRAFTAILDGHVTMFISGLILAQYGTGPVKGFAITLIVGIIASLFTGVFCTRVVFDWWVRGAKVKRLSVGAEF
jgi:preprotein translocase subunit SecD